MHCVLVVAYTCCTCHYRSDINTAEQGSGRAVSNRVQNEYTTNERKFEQDINADNEVIRGVPQQPAKAPTHLTPDITFDTCGGSSRSNSRQREVRGSQGSLSLPRTHSRESSPRTRASPIPRQRVPESLLRTSISDHEYDSPRRRDQQRSHREQPISPRRQLSAEDAYHSFNRREPECQRSYDSHSYKQMAGHNGHVPSRSVSDNGYYTDNVSSPRRQHATSPRHLEESIYKTPRRYKYSDDGVSSDSGVQHMTCHN